MDNPAWDDFGGYMRAKKQKLDQQFQEEETIFSAPENVVASEHLFKGVTIHVNGYTKPSAPELKAIIRRHGGDYQHYYHKGTCTHIIATNLPTAKIRQLGDETIVRPEWIMDSLKANHLLPVHNYFIVAAPNQPRLSFHTSPVSKQTLPQSTVVEEPTASPTTASIECEREAPVAQISVHQENNLVDNNTLDPSESVEQIDQCMDENKSMEHEARETAKVHREPSTRPATGRISTIDNPEFIDQYYKSSRLSHLSRWGAAIRQFTSTVGDTPNPLALVVQQAIENGAPRIIMHVDMDCFFVSVSLLNHPQYANQPVAVCHARGTASANSTSEVASVNYAARAKGLKNGMYLGPALRLCPELVTLPYDFEAYERVSKQLYRIILERSPLVQAVSCDEAFIDVTGICMDIESAKDYAEKMRAAIFEETHCTASVGIGPNIMLARIATKRAKPNGVFAVDSQTGLLLLDDMDVGDLPGVGWNIKKRLANDMNVSTCKQLRDISLHDLKRAFGEKLGARLYSFARGIDTRSLKTAHACAFGKQHERKSLSAEVNWGVRFTAEGDVVIFLTDLAREVSKRLVDEGFHAEHLTLKMKETKDGTEPAKFLGCGVCDDHSRSTPLSTPTNSAEAIARACIRLAKQMNIAPDRIRGVGIQMTKLTPSQKRQGSNVTRATTGDITSYLKARNSDASPSKQSTELSKDDIDHLLGQHGIDYTTFMELPEDVRSSYLKELKGENYSKNAVKKPQPQTTPQKPGTPVKKDTPSPRRVVASEKKRQSGSPYKIKFKTPDSSPSKVSEASGPAKNTQERIKLYQSGPSQWDPDIVRAIPQHLLPVADPSSPGPQGQRHTRVEVGALELTPSQWDPSVLEELPKDILASLRKRYPDTVSLITTEPSATPEPATNAAASYPEPRLETPSQWDPAVIAELPEDVIAELNHHRNLRKELFKKPEDILAELPPELLAEARAQIKSHQQQQMTAEKSPKKETLPSLPSSTSPVCLGEVSMDQIRGKLKNLIQTGEEPQEEVVDSLTTFVLTCVKQRELESLQLLISWLARHVRKASPMWKDAFHHLRNLAIDQVQQVYHGARLSLPTIIE